MKFLFCPINYKCDNFISFCDFILELKRKYSDEKIGDDNLLYQYNNELKNYLTSCLQDPEISKSFNKKYDSNLQRLIKDTIGNARTITIDFQKESKNYESVYIFIAFKNDCFILHENVDRLNINTIWPEKDYYVYCFNIANYKNRINNFFIYERNPKHDKLTDKISLNLFPDDINQKILYASNGEHIVMKDIEKYNFGRRWYYYDSQYVVLPLTSASESGDKVIFHSYNPQKDIDERVIRFYQK